ncbi:ATP-binding protein [Falsiroseomonas sp. HW251]|uniref:ATP-binding protein n=1 Tax=Falsiroseomonas sp. HW251 TaxID=3390998 RepID=UPI003D317FB8
MRRGLLWLDRRLGRACATRAGRLVYGRAAEAILRCSEAAMEHYSPLADPALIFDGFRLLPRQRLLLEDGKPVRIGSRAFDILLALLERRGERVGKAELIARAWPGTHVVEGNLKFQIAALRRALRDGQDGRRLIEASKGLGYSFVAAVTVAEGGGRAPESHHSAPPAEGARRHNLPEQITALVGCDDIVAKLADQLARNRLLTIVGAGGIGKTSVALAVAERFVGVEPDGVWLIDLARITEPGQLLGAVAGPVNVEVRSGMTMRDLVAALRARRMLLVVDNCAHLIDAAAELVAAVLRGAPQIRILATSREALRCEGERLCRLGPLDAPPATASLGAAEALRFPAVQLFVQHAAASLDGFELTDEDAPRAAEICRKLDGIPLAIELAAAWVGVLGLRGLAAQLDDRLRLLTGGRRTALPRHRTMRAALDWSHDLLRPAEQTIFRRLAIFVGGFTLTAAAGIAGEESLPADDVVQTVLALAAKSLVVADLDSPGSRFRLLDTTRAYALEKLRQADEVAPVARRHATWLLALLESVADRERREGDEGYAAAEADIDNLRAALAWAFDPAGDAAIGVGLAAASLPLWFSTSLLGEAHGWTERALDLLEEAGLRGTWQEMMLQTAFGVSLQAVKGRTSDAHRALTRALAIAEQLQDRSHRLLVLHDLWIYHMRVGEVRTALDLARQAEAVGGALAEQGATATAAWMLGSTLHFAGDHAAARAQLEPLLLEAEPWPGRHQIRRAGFDPHVSARYILAHVLWVQGHGDQASDAVHAALEQARRVRHPLTLCSTLAWGACALALLAGDLEDAAGSAAELIDLAQKHAFADHLSYGLAAQEIIRLQQAGPAAGADQVRAALARWRASQWHAFLNIGDFALAAAQAGFGEEIAATVEEALQRAERNGEFWAYPEILRIKGELLLHDARVGAAARECFTLALDRARAQGALAWQLRSATSLYRVDRDRGDAAASRDLLERTIAAFREGLGSRDLKVARQLLSGAPDQD